MPGSQKKAARPSTAARPRPAAEVAALAASGRHEEAIALATAMLGEARLAVADRLEILDLRAESHIALGDLDSARADADAMLDHARRARKPAFQAQALSRCAYVEIRSGKSRDAVTTADSALQAARRARQRPLEAVALLRQAEALFRIRENERAAKSATQAARLFKALGQPAFEGRAWWATAAARAGQGRGEEADRAAHKAAALARRSGDLHGLGNAINMLTFHEPDIAQRMRLLQQARAAFQAAGYVERQAIITHNLGILYDELGLYRRARRLLTQARDAYVRAGATGSGLAVTSFVLGTTEYELGLAAAAKANLAYAADRWQAAGVIHAEAYRLLVEGRLALWDGDPARAVSLFERVAGNVRGSDEVSLEINSLDHLCEACLAAGDPGKALRSSTQATALIHARGSKEIQGITAAEVWWHHYEALRVNGRTAEARRALAIAYRLLVEPIGKLTDEGMRRNYLGKREFHRKVVLATLADRGRAAKRRPVHLTGASTLQEPFERLVDTGLRMNELRSPDELREFLIDETTELSGAERVLLVVASANGPQLAGSLVPKGEDAATLMQDVIPDLMGAARTRAASLTYVPEKASELAQRSRIVAPLIARNEVVGFLYADLGGAFGRFHDADRDLLAMLASQAAVALDNAQWSQGLEQRVAQRTEELSSANALLKQRANELAIINGIQEGISASLDFQAIVDLVGDKLREVFRTGDIGVRWRDDATGLARYLYEYEHGQRIFPAPSRIRPDSPITKAMNRREAFVTNTRAEAEAFGIGLIPGTDRAQSMVVVPVVGGDHVLGSIVMENHDRENAFGEAEVRLLSTVAASMGVALENARLFDETQRRTRETAALAEVGREIGSSLDLATVMQRIARHAKDLLNAENSAIFLPDAGGAHFRAIVAIGDAAEAIRDTVIETGVGIIGNLVLRGEAAYVNDTQADPRAIQIMGTNKKEQERLMVAPLLAGQAVKGVMALWRIAGGPFDDAELAFFVGLSRQAVIAIQNARLFNETNEALDQQRASSEVLAAISSSIADTAPVFDTILESCERLFGGKVAGVNLVGEDGLIHLRAYHGPGREALEKVFPLRIGPDSASGAAIETRNVVHYPDVEFGEEVPEYTRQGCMAVGYKSVIFAPMVWEGRGIGVIFVGRAFVGPFSEKDIALLKTFADQAVIAIQNARLFSETQEALSHQTATADILRVISSSPTDVQPVFDAIARNAVALCGSLFANVFRYDGELIHWVSSDRYAANAVEILRSTYPMRPSLSQVSGRVVLTKAIVRMEDALADPDYDHRFARAGGWRRMLGVPMMREGNPIGVIVAGWAETGPIPKAQEELLKTFADQAVIAIENVRLFNETKDALERQTATAEVLQVISSSVADAAPVFDKILDCGQHLFATEQLGIFLVKDDGQVHAGAWRGAALDSIARAFPKPLADTMTERVINERRTVYLPHAAATPDVPAAVRNVVELIGNCSIAWAPMLWEDRGVGSFAVLRQPPRPFTGKELTLLKTFADQAVIAIQNARLFNETKESLERQTATAEVLRVISESPTDVQPVLEAVAERAGLLCRADGSRIWLVADGQLRAMTTYGRTYQSNRDAEVLPIRRTSIAGRAVLDRRFVHVEDVLPLLESEYPDVRELQARYGFRTALNVPLLREGEAVGVIALLRNEVRPFAPAEIGLVQTFADQAVIAIQNARLFNARRRRRAPPPRRPTRRRARSSRR